MQRCKEAREHVGDRDCSTLITWNQKKTQKGQQPCALLMSKFMGNDPLVSSTPLHLSSFEMDLESSSMAFRSYVFVWMVGLAFEIKFLVAQPII